MKNNAGRMVPVVVLLASVTAAASAQQVMWKDNPITGKVVGLTYGTSGWNAAEAQAVAYGGHLVTISSDAENQWLLDQFSANWSVGQWYGWPAGPWIGLNDVQNEGSWQWTAAAPYGYSAWNPGEPSNGNGAEDWGHFFSTGYGWKWNDAPQEMTFRSLIEAQQRPPRSWSWPSTVYTGTALYFQSLADHDGDGDLDVAMQDHGDGNVWILKNDGTGSFSIHQSIPIPWPMNSIGYDWGNDGNMDLLVVSSLPSPGGSVYLLTKNSAGMFVNQGIALDFKGAWSIESSDVNADGLDDLLVTSFSPVPAVGVYLSNANKTFASQPSSVVSLTSTYPYFSAVKDLDGDGDKDVAVGSNSQIHILKNTGNGSFLAMPSLGSGGCTRPMLVDVDGDGDIDIVQFRDASSECVVWSNDGGANFTPSGLFATQGASRDSDIADLNADGLLDIVVANMSTDTTDVYLANSNGQYVFDHSLASGDYPLGARIGDLNGDGKGDICITNHLSRTLAVMLNQSRFDCNGNGIEDATDIANGTAVDCNNNKRPDSCDIAFGYSQDSDNDGVLNDCEATLVSITPSTRPAALSGNVTLNATNIPAGPATLTLTSPALPTPITLPITLVATTGAYTPTTASVTLPSLTTLLPLGSADDVTCSGTLSWVDNQGTTQTTGATASIFTFDVPEIVAATPGNAPFDASTGVLFQVKDFVASSGVGLARFGSAPAQIAYLIQAGSQKLVSTTAPPQASAGPVGVRLEFGAEIALETRGFVYLGPGVTSLSATEGWQAGGDSLTLDLVDFVPGTPVLVRIGGGEASGTPSGFLAASSVSIVTPQSLSSGAVDVEVIQFLGQANEKRALSPGAWLAEAPRIVGITPASVYQGGGESLTLSLEGLAPNQTTQVELGTQVYTGLNAGTVDLSSFSLVTQLANAAGTVDVRVRQNLGQPTELGALLANGLTIVGPSITALLPTAGPLEGGTNVTVQTSGFQDGVAAQVSLGGFSVPGTVVGSGTSQTVSFQTVLANASGPANLTITQGVFQASVANAFTFDPARVVPYCVSTPSSQGGLPVIGFTGSPSLSVNNFSLTLQNALPNKTAQYIYGQQPTNFPYPTGGTICVGVGVIRGPGTMTSASGTASVPFVIPSALVGQKRYFQYWYRDPAAGGLGFSNALEVEFYP